MKPKALLMIMMSLFSLAHGQPSTQKTYHLLIGTYTRPGKSEGIYVYRFNIETGESSLQSSAPGITNPSFLTVTRDRKFVYSVSEQGNGNGSVHAYAYDAKTGKLTFINKVNSGGDAPCYVSVDQNNKFVFVGNYTGGSLAAIPINPDGSLNENTQVIQHEGSGPKKNQDKAHVHATVLSENEKFLFVPDLGTDKINIYQVNPSLPKPLTPANPAFVSVQAGSGPRHFTFHPKKKYAYLIQEMMGIVTVFDYAEGKLKAKQSVTLPSSGFTGKIDAADIHVSPDGKFLYGSLRGDIHELVIYAIDKSGKLTYAGRQSTLGKIPRNFAIDPSGKFLLAANQNSDEIIVFKRDTKTGLLADTGKRIAVGAPVSLTFVAVD